MTKLYVIEGIEEVMQKIQESIPLIRRGQKNYCSFLTIFLKWIAFWTKRIYPKYQI